MNTIQVIVDDDLLRRIDRYCGSRNRSRFFREAAELLLRRQAISEKEQQEQEAYKKMPVRRGEFDVWESEQAWDE